MCSRDRMHGHVCVVQRRHRYGFMVIERGDRCVVVERGHRCVVHGCKVQRRHRQRACGPETEYTGACSREDAEEGFDR